MLVTTLFFVWGVFFSFFFSEPLRTRTHDLGVSFTDTTMIKVFQMMLLLNRSQIMMKPASTFYKLKFPIEKRLQTTCLLLIVIIEWYMQSETTQMLHMRSIVLCVEGSIALNTALP